MSFLFHYGTVYIVQWTTVHEQYYTVSYLSVFLQELSNYYQHISSLTWHDLAVRLAPPRPWPPSPSSTFLVSPNPISPHLIQYSLTGRYRYSTLFCNRITTNFPTLALHTVYVTIFLTSHSISLSVPSSSMYIPQPLLNFLNVVVILPYTDDFSIALTSFIWDDLGLFI